MRRKHSVYLMGGVLAGAMALGCQAPPSSQPGAVPGAPRAVVHYGAVKLDPDADMAIVLTRTDCDEKGYALKQAGPDPRVDHIIVEVTGPGLVEPYKQTLTRGAFGGLCDATLNLAGLSTGTYSVRFTSYNATKDPVAYANGSVSVANGQTSQLNLACNFNLGKLDVNIHCCDDGASPTPVPSSSITPTPTPTPSTVVLPSSYRAYGFAVDSQAVVYVSCPDLSGGVGTGAAPQQLIRIDPANWTGVPTVVSDDVGAINEGEFSGDVFKALYDVFGNTEDIITFDASSPTPIASLYPLSPQHGQGQVGHAYVANTTNPQTGDFYYSTVIGYTTPTSTFDIFREGLVPYMDYTAPAPSPWTDYMAPLQMEWASDEGGPIWTSGLGILKRTGANPNAAPTPLVAGPAYGLVLPHGDTSSMLFTRWQPYHELNLHPGSQDPDIYFARADGAGGYTVRSVATCINGWVPRSIESGPDGYYVMVIPASSQYDQAFRIIKMEWDDTIPGQETLRPVHVVVDAVAPGELPSFPSPTP